MSTTTTTTTITKSSNPTSITKTLKSPLKLRKTVTGDSRNSITLVQELLRRTVRAFYDDECVAIVETILSEHRCIRDEDIASMLSMQPALVRSKLIMMRADHVVHCIGKDEAKKRGIGKAKSDFYFVDYKNFVDVLRWKLYTLKHSAAKEPSVIQDSYICNHCQKKFKSIEAASLINMMTGQFQCDICKNELQEIKIENDLSTTIKIHQKLNVLVKPLHNLVKSLETHTLPIVEWPIELYEKNMDDEHEAWNRKKRAQEAALLLDGIPDISVEILPTDDALIQDQQITGGGGDQQKTLPPWMRTAKEIANDTVLTDEEVQNQEKQKAKEKFFRNAAKQWCIDARKWMKDNNVDLNDLKQELENINENEIQDAAQLKNTLRMMFLRAAVYQDSVYEEQMNRFVREFLRQTQYLKCDNLWASNKKAKIEPKKE